MVLRRTFSLCFVPFYYYSFLKFNIGLAMVWQYAHHGKRIWAVAVLGNNIVE